MSEGHIPTDGQQTPPRLPGRQVSYIAPDEVIPIVNDQGQHHGFVETYPTQYVNNVIILWDHLDMAIVNFYSMYVAHDYPPGTFSESWHMPGHGPRPSARLAMTPEAMLDASERMRKLALEMIEAKRQAYVERLAREKANSQET